MTKPRITTAAQLYAVLQEFHRRNAQLPSGVTITGLINALPPAEQVNAQKYLSAYDMAHDGLKPAPFAQPISKGAVLLDASMDSPEQPDEKAADWILETARQEVVTSELINRMGSDADRAPAEPTMRDHIDAAVTAVMGEQA